MAPDSGEPAPSGGPLAGYRIGIVVSERDAPSARLAAAAERWLSPRGAAVSRHPAAAAFEVAQVAGWLAEQREVDGIVACAAIVRGETSHDRVLGSAVTGALLEIGVRTGVPVGNAVLTVRRRNRRTPVRAATRATGARTRPAPWRVSSAPASGRGARAARAASTSAPPPGSGPGADRERPETDRDGPPHRPLPPAGPRAGDPDALLLGPESRPAADHGRRRG